MLADNCPLCSRPIEPVATPCPGCATAYHDGCLTSGACVVRGCGRTATTAARAATGAGLAWSCALHLVDGLWLLWLAIVLRHAYGGFEPNSWFEEMDAAGIQLLQVAAVAGTIVYGARIVRGGPGTPARALIASALLCVAVFVLVQFSDSYSRWNRAVALVPEPLRAAERLVARNPSGSLWDARGKVMLHYGAEVLTGVYVAWLVALTFALLGLRGDPRRSRASAVSAFAVVLLIVHLWRCGP